MQELFKEIMFVLFTFVGVVLLGIALLVGFSSWGIRQAYKDEKEGDHE